MNLVLFKDAIEHMTRISRLLRQQRGHYTLVVVGGSGNKSLTQLGAVFAGCKIETIESKKNYGKKEFKEDLFKMMCSVGIDNKRIAFSFSDTQILQEGFLEDVNNLLNSGEVQFLIQIFIISNMLTKDDLEIINQDCRQKQENSKLMTFILTLSKKLDHIYMLYQDYLLQMDNQELD